METRLDRRRLVPALVNSGRKVYLYAIRSGRAAAALALGEAAVWWPLHEAGVKPGELGGAPVGVMGDSPVVS
jgi:hypothetical protein